MKSIKELYCEKIWYSDKFTFDYVKKMRKEEDNQKIV